MTYPEFLYEWLRLMAYVFVISVSIAHIIKGTSNRWICAGNIVLAFILALAVLHYYILKNDTVLFIGILLPIAALIWAAFHFVSMLSVNCKHDKSKKRSSVESSKVSA